MKRFKVVAVAGLMACLVLVPQLVRADHHLYKFYKKHGTEINVQRSITIYGVRAMFVTFRDLDGADAFDIEDHQQADYSRVHLSDGVILLKKDESRREVIELYRVRFDWKLEQQQMCAEAFNEREFVVRFVRGDAKLVRHYRRVGYEGLAWAGLGVAGLGVATFYLYPMQRMGVEDGEFTDYLLAGSLVGSGGYMVKLGLESDYYQWMSISTLDGSRRVLVDVPADKIGRGIAELSVDPFVNLGTLESELQDKGFRVRENRISDAGRGADVNLTHIGVGPIRNRGLGFVARFRF